MASPSTSRRNAKLVSILLPDLRIGGAERISVTLAQELVKLGYAVDFVLAQAEGELIEGLPENVCVYDLGSPRIRNLIKPLAKYVSNRSPDVLIANMWPLTVSAIFVKLLTNTGTRIVVVEHAALSHQYSHRSLIHTIALRTSIGLFYPLADKRIGVSRGVADDTSDLGRISRKSFEVIYNPIIIRDREAKSDDCVEHNWRSWSGPRLLTVGRLKKQKNHALLIRAFKHLLATHDARLLILGSGELGEATVEVARAEGVIEKVFMPGETLNPAPYYRSADLFVLSSDYEGLPTVLVEALSFGLPVVSTDCRSGPAEILENGRYGVLSPVGDADALAKAMAVALAKTWDREQLKQRALDFAPEKAAREYVRVMFENVER